MSNILVKTSYVMSAYRAASLLALVGSLASASFLAVVYVTSPLISHSGLEQNVIFGIQTLLRGEDLYRDPAYFPFVVTQYTPIFYNLCFAVSRIFGIVFTDVREIYLVGRLISAVASFGCCLIIFQMLTRYTALDRKMRFALAFLFPVMVSPWSFVARPDPLYIFFIAAGLLTAMLYSEKARLHTLVASAIFLLAAYYTKQSAAFFFPLPFIVGFARHGRRVFRPRDLLICLTVYGAGVGFMGPTMIANFSIALSNGIDIPWAFRVVYIPLVLQQAPILLAAVLGYWQGARAGRWESRAIGLATLWFMIVGAILAIKWGSNTNYFHEFLMGCVVTIGMVPCFASPVADFKQRWTALLVIGLVIVGQVSYAVHNRPRLQSALTPRDEMYRTGYEFRSDPELSGQQILVLDFSSLIFIPDRAVFAPIEILGSAAATGHFDLTRLTREIRAGRLCFAVSDEFMLKQLMGTGPNYGAWNARMHGINAILLADFQVTRSIGSRLVLTSPSCRAAAR